MQKNSSETHSVGEKTNGVYYKVKWAVSQDVEVVSGQRDHCGRKHSKDETEHLGGPEVHRERKSSQGATVDSGQRQMWRETWTEDMKTIVPTCILRHALYNVLKFLKQTTFCRASSHPDD